MHIELRKEESLFKHLELNIEHNISKQLSMH